MAQPDRHLKAIRFNADPSQFTLQGGVSLTSNLIESGVTLVDKETVCVNDMSRAMDFCYKNRPPGDGFLLEFLHKSSSVYLMDCAVSCFIISIHYIMIKSPKESGGGRM